MKAEKEKMNKKYPYWEDVERDDYDKKKGYQLCPHCGKDSVEHLIDLDDEDEETVTRERCKNGCYIFDFTIMKRVA